MVSEQTDDYCEIVEGTGIKTSHNVPRSSCLEFWVGTSVCSPWILVKSMVSGLPFLSCDAAFGTRCGCRVWRNKRPTESLGRDIMRPPSVREGMYTQFVVWYVSERSSTSLLMNKSWSLGRRSNGV